MEIKDEKLYPYKIKSSKRSFDVLQHKERKTKDGDVEQYWKRLSYHANIPSALKKILKKKLSDEDKVYDLEDVIEEIKSLTNILTIRS